MTVDDSLEISAVVAVCRDFETVSLGDTAEAAMAETREIVEELADADDRPVYGINTGFGDLVDVSIPRDRQRQLQQNLLSANTTVGDPLPIEEVRAGMLARAAVLAAGHSGTRPLVVKRIFACLNEGIHPVLGDRGNSDDYGANARIGSVLTGDGMVFYEGTKQPAQTALETAGIEPLDIQPKEALSIMDGPGLMTGRLALSVHDAFHLMLAADVAAAATFACIGKQPSAFSPRVISVRPHQGDAQTASVIRELLSLDTTAYSTVTQDPLSIRTIPQVHGSAREQLRHATTIAETELASPGDNPLVFPDGEVLSCGGFNGQHVSAGADALSRALVKVGHGSERRTHLFMQGRGISPRFAARDPGVGSGLIRAHYSAASLVREAETNATASARNSVVSAGQEDIQSLGTVATANLYETIENIRGVVAIELLTALEVIDIADPTLPQPLENTLAGLYAQLPEDRTEQIAAVEQHILDGELTDRVRSAGIEVPPGPTSD